MASKTEAKTVKRYFIVNPAGAVHEVDYEHARWRLGQKKGFRMAEKHEVEAYLNTAVQVAEKPIARPYTEEPEAIELPAAAD
ncbi:MAG: hypothetical protein L6R45_29760 [Anaerolineae bacterium]|nr:hypothetical protein [Anaerolineae bacterium]